MLLLCCCQLTLFVFFFASSLVIIAYLSKPVNNFFYFFAFYFVFRRFSTSFNKFFPGYSGSFWHLISGARFILSLRFENVNLFFHVFYCFFANLYFFSKFRFIEPRYQLNTTSTKPLLHGNIQNHATTVFLFPLLSLADIAFEEFRFFKDTFKLPELCIRQLVIKEA